MLFLSDMLVGYNCVDVDHFFVFLCHSPSVIPQMCFSLFSSLSSVWGDFSEQSVRAGWDSTCLLHHSHHERTGAGRHLRCLLHDLRSGQ